MIWGILIFIAVLVIDLWTDVDRYFDGRKVNHTRGAIFRVIGLAPAVYFMGWLSAPMLFFLYIILFNGLYNTFIGQKWEYVGDTAKMDRLQRKYPILKTIKYIAFIASAILYAIL